MIDLDVLYRNLRETCYGNDDIANVIYDAIKTVQEQVDAIKKRLDKVESKTDKVSDIANYVDKPLY